MFYLSGVMNGRYPDREIMNLGRYVDAFSFLHSHFKLN
jgi:hypothetical protein